MTSLLVAEVFGPTIQGEGPSTGRLASFIRLGACNLHCAWCDTPYTWDRTRHDLRAELTTRPADDLVAEVLTHDTPLVVITGGEPLLQQHRPGWARLVTGLLDAHRAVEVETNGTLTPARHWPRVTFNVSPKLTHAGDPEPDRLRPDTLAAFASLARLGTAVWKFVAHTPDDLTDIDAIVTTHDVPRTAVWIMPEGTTPDTVTATGRDLAETAIRYGFNITTRLHVLLWGQERRR